MSPVHWNYALQYEHLERIKYIAHALLRWHPHLSETRQCALYSEWIQFFQQRVKTAVQSSLTEICCSIQTVIFPSQCEYSLTISIKAVMINKDFLYKMPGQEKEMSFYPIYSHLPVIHSHPQDMCLADLSLKKQKDTSVWDWAFFKAYSAGLKKRSQKLCLSNCKEWHIYHNMRAILLGKGFSITADHLIFFITINTHILFSFET